MGGTMNKRTCNNYYIFPLNYVKSDTHFPHHSPLFSIPSISEVFFLSRIIGGYPETTGLDFGDALM